MIARAAEPDDTECRITQSARFQHPRYHTTGSSESTSASSCNFGSHAHQHRTSLSRIIFSNVLFFLLCFLIPGIFGLPADTNPSGLSFHPRSKSRWSRHIGQCYSSISFSHFFFCTLLPRSLFLSLSISHFFSGTLNTILFTKCKLLTIYERVNYFLRA